MKTPRRKITVQLVALLDLMLVVLFLQFMELSERTQMEEARASQAVELTERERDTLKAERIEVAQERREAEMIAETAFDQRDLVGKLAAELFNLPDEAVSKLLQQRFPDDPLDEAEVAAMQQEFRKLRGRRGQELIKHLLTFHELRKRADVWELSVSETGLTTLKAAGDEVSFRSETPREFAAKLFEKYRLMAQPKNLVLIVLSYGDVKAATYEAALTGLPLAIDHLQADAAGRTRFEYAVLGYDPRAK